MQIVTLGGEPELRAARRDELPALCALLQAAFSDQVGALRYVLPVLGYLSRAGEAAQPPFNSLVLVGITEILGVAVLSPRRLAWRGETLAGLHMGPIAVHPTWQGRGLGRRLVEAAEAQAQARGVDLLSLTVAEGSLASQLYASAGFEVFQRLTPWLRPLNQASAPQVEGTPWPSTWPPPPTSPERIVEQSPLTTPVPAALSPQHIRAAGGEALTLRWPVLQPPSGWTWSTQLIALRRPSPQLLDAVAYRAGREGSAVLWGMPEVAGELHGFEPAYPASLRMLKGLTPAGERAMLAEDYVAFGPAG